MDVALLIVVALAVVVGAVSQRVSGMGLGLVAAPFLVILIGPFEGVLMINICAVIATSLVIGRVWRNIDWKQYVLLTIPAVITVIPSSLISVSVTGPTLQVVVGVILIVALTASLIVTRTSRTFAATPSALLFGSLSGFMGTTAGTGGPPVAIYAVLTSWKHSQFAATVQPFFATLGVTAFVVKIVASGTSLHTFNWLVAGVVVVSILVGLVFGELLVGRVSSRAAVRGVITIAYAGALIALMGGVMSM